MGGGKAEDGRTFRTLSKRRCVVVTEVARDVACQWYVGRATVKTFSLQSAHENSSGLSNLRGTF